MYKDNFSQMTNQAVNNGLSKKYDINSFTANSGQHATLESAYQAFLKANPDFNDGTFIDEEVAFHQPTLQEIVENKINKARSGFLARAVILKSYSRDYEPGDEGTGWHNDINTGADLIIVHTLFGSAYFDAIDGYNQSYSSIHTAGSVIAFLASTQHCAGSPLDNEPRKIEGIGIKFR
jgi:hypothetical protein